MTTLTPTAHQVYEIVTILTYVVTAASMVANMFPHHEEVEGNFGKVLKVLNFIALNLRKVKK